MILTIWEKWIKTIAKFVAKLWLEIKNLILQKLEIQTKVEPLQLHSTELPKEHQILQVLYVN